MIEVEDKSNKLENRVVNKKAIIRIAVFFAILLISLLSFIPTDSLEELINFNYFAKNVVTKNDNKIHFIDVGQGDCTVIEFVDGKIMMIDNGPKEKWNKINTYFEFLKLPKKIDYLILTHTDNDHVGNTEKLLDNFEINNIYIPKVYSNIEVANGLNENKNYKVQDNFIWNNICYKMRKVLPLERINYIDNVISINNDEDLTMEYSYTIHIFPPKLDYYEDDNEYSPIIWARIGYHQALFTGDASKQRELEFLEDARSIINMPMLFNIEILKIGHHGSKTSSDLEFLQTINPRFCVISCGKNNTYGHPANETINNIMKVKQSMKVYRTDIHNSIICANTFKGDLPNIVVKYNFENFDNIYVELYYIVIIINIITFMLLIVPIVFTKKVKLFVQKESLLEASSKDNKINKKDDKN